MSLSDAECARQRAERFGKLPTGVRPDDLVELVETVPRRDRPETALSEDQWAALHAPG